MVALSRESQKARALQQPQPRRKTRQIDYDASTMMSPTSPTGTMPRWTVSPTQTMRTNGGQTMPRNGYATYGRTPTTPGTAFSPMSHFSTMGRQYDLNSPSSVYSGTLMRTRNGLEMPNPLHDLISTPSIDLPEAYERLKTGRPKGVIDKAYSNSW